MNEKFAKILKLMSDYDASTLGTQEKSELGQKLDKEGSKLSERDFWKIVYSYKGLKKGN